MVPQAGSGLNANMGWVLVPATQQGQLTGEGSLPNPMSMASMIPLSQADATAHAPLANLQAMMQQQQLTDAYGQPLTFVHMSSTASNTGSSQANFTFAPPSLTPIPTTTQQHQHQPQAEVYQGQESQVNIAIAQAQPMQKEPVPNQETPAQT